MMMKVLIVGDQSEMDSEMGPEPLASPLLVSSTLLGQVRSGRVRYSARVWGHEIFWEGTGTFTGTSKSE